MYINTECIHVLRRLAALYYMYKGGGGGMLSVFTSPYRPWNWFLKMIYKNKIHSYVLSCKLCSKSIKLTISRGCEQFLSVPHLEWVEETWKIEQPSSKWVSRRLLSFWLEASGRLAHCLAAQFLCSLNWFQGTERDCSQSTIPIMVSPYVFAFSS